jgi:serine/tyrosine/threonine adenylyltransferase
MRVGFVHGVMNTDNMSILGLTIDYGPYGWLEDFDPNWTPNTTDAATRRYRYGQQPAIVQWNLVRLAEALRPVFVAPEPLEAGLEAFLAVYDDAYERTMAAKFGFASPSESAQHLMREAFGLMHATQADFTRFFRALGDLPAVWPHDASVADLLGDVFYSDDALGTHHDRLLLWLRRWHAEVSAQSDGPSARRARMHAVNPRYVLRNWLAQEAIDLAEAGDASRVRELLALFRAPYSDQPGMERFDAMRPEWARHKAGCSMLSCSS